VSATGWPGGAQPPGTGSGRLRLATRADRRRRRGRLQRHSSGGGDRHGRGCGTRRGRGTASTRSTRRRPSWGGWWPTSLRPSTSTGSTTARPSVLSASGAGPLATSSPTGAWSRSTTACPEQVGRTGLNHVRELFEGYGVTVTDIAEGARPGWTCGGQGLCPGAGRARARQGGLDRCARFSQLSIPR